MLCHVMDKSILSEINSNPIHGIYNPLSTDLFNNLPVAIYSCDEQGYITSYNKAAVKLWGRNPETGKDLWCGSWKIFKPNGDPLPLDSCPMARALKEGKPIEGEEIIVQRPDGSRRNVIPHPVPVFSAGRLTGAVNTLIDITEQKIGEEKQAILAAIVDSSDDAIISKTLDGIITSWNRAAENMFGYKENEILGKNINILIPPSRSQEEKTIIESIRSGKAINHFETVRVTKNGDQIPISLTVSPVRDNYGRITGASKIVRDITSQHQAQQKMQLYYQQLEKMNSYKDEFIGMASHELKTPLTSVNLYLQMLERSQEDERNKKFVKQAVNQIGKLTSLVSDLLDVSKIQTGKLILRLSNFDLDELLNEVAVIILETSSSSHAIEIDYDLTAKKNITADRQRIEQVLINLLTNAVKYSPYSDKIMVKVIHNGDLVRVSVKDFGIGIPQAQQDKIFTRFYRIEELEPLYSGLGIGLYISSEIIARHGGKLWVESRQGEGSTFLFEIPVFPDK